MSNLAFENTDPVLIEKRQFLAPSDVIKHANITAYMQSKGFEDYASFYKWSLEHRTEFWDDQARELDWFQVWHTTFQWTNKPFFQWFSGGQFNIVYNCLDRHMQTRRRTKIAYYWEADDGTTRTITYEQLYKMTNQFAKGLQLLGVQKGDRVAIYLPMIPELPAAMLAVARLGAVHMVVFAGFAPNALRDRITDSEAKVLITADGYYRGGRYINLKQLADEALVDTPTIEKSIVVSRLGHDVPMQAGRDIYWDTLAADIPEDTFVPCEPMDSEDLLYILYTVRAGVVQSIGSAQGTIPTGKAKGVVHVHAGYAVGVYATTKFVFDVKDSDVYWCAAEIGWMVGHSYAVYGPLMTGVTSVIFEGTPIYPAPDRLWRIVEKYNVNTLYTSPTVIRGLMRFGEEWPAKRDISSLRLLGTVGETINPEAWMWYRRNIGRDELPIMDTWWQTETGMVLIAPTVGLPLKPGSVSCPFPTIEADVVDEHGLLVSAGACGLLVIRHPWPAQMRGIYKDSACYQAYWDSALHLSGYNDIYRGPQDQHTKDARRDSALCLSANNQHTEDERRDSALCLSANNQHTKDERRDSALCLSVNKTNTAIYFTGDTAIMDNDGCFRIQGRVDDMIKVSGQYLGSMEIESSLASHPAVAEAIAIGKPDPLKGQHVKVFVILRQGFAPSEELEKDLQMHIRTTVSALAVPHELEFVPGLPKLHSDKIMHRIIRSLELSVPFNDISLFDT